MFMADSATCFQVLTQESEFKYGFWGFGHILGLFLLFCLGFMVLQFGSLNKVLKQFLWNNIRGKSKGLRTAFPLGQISDEKNKLKVLEKSKSISTNLVNGNSDRSESELKVLEKSKSIRTDLVNGNSDRSECFLEDEECDVMVLRKLVKMERKRANAVCADLEKERMAAASAADEAMAMILRLQNEKSTMEIETNQFRRMAERKEEYDQEVIQSLQWLVMKYELDVKVLEDELQKCKTKLALCVEDGELDGADEGDGSIFPFTSSEVEAL